MITCHDRGQAHRNGTQAKCKYWLSLLLLPWNKQRHYVPTTSGPISVVVCGDQDKPALLTYSDVGLNCENPSSLLLFFSLFLIKWFTFWNLTWSLRHGSTVGLSLDASFPFLYDCTFHDAWGVALLERKRAMESVTTIIRGSCVLSSVKSSWWMKWEVSLSVSSCFYVPALIADVSCFGGLFSCPEASSMLYHNFCIYHVDAPGHEVSTLFH